MADNTTLDPGSGGDTIRTEDISGVKYPVTKLYTGAAGVNGGPVTPANPLSVQAPHSTTASVPVAIVNDEADHEFVAAGVRDAVIIENRSMTAVRLRLGATAATLTDAGSTYLLLPRGRVTVRDWDGAIHGISEGTNGYCVVTTVSR